VNSSATTFEKKCLKEEDCNKATAIMLKLNMLDIIVFVRYFLPTLKVISIVVALFSIYKIRIGLGFLFF
jgi:hypothetical protein